MADPLGYQMPLTDLAYDLMPGITPDRINTLLIQDLDPDAERE